jgi:hypothetical protein
VGAGIHENVAHKVPAMLGPCRFQALAVLVYTPVDQYVVADSPLVVLVLIRSPYGTSDDGAGRSCFS